MYRKFIAKFDKESRYLIYSTFVISLFFFAYGIMRTHINTLTATCVCLSQARKSISNVICVVLFCVQLVKVWKIIIRFVNICGIVDNVAV